MTTTTVLLHHAVVGSPVGDLTLVASPTGLREVGWGGGEPTAGTVGPAGDDPILASVSRQLEEYFAGARRSFDLPLDPEGTAFQRAVWSVLGEVPFGTTVSYGELAARSGHPGAARAVGGAVGRNPLSIVVPCHRVVGADGSLTGFGGGLAAKAWLLDHERGGLSRG